MVGTRNSLSQLGLVCTFNTEHNTRVSTLDDAVVNKSECEFVLCMPLLPPFYALFGLTNVQAIAAHSENIYTKNWAKKSQPQQQQIATKN